MSLRKVLAVIATLLLPAALLAQSSLLIGYNIGLYRQAHHNLQAYSQMYNLNAGPELEEPLKMTGFYRGVVIGWKKNGDHFMGGMRWTTKKAVSSMGENADESIKLRLRMNTINMELGVGGRAVKAGISFDIGGLRVHKKTTNKKTGVETNWEKFYESNALLGSGSLATAFTLFLDIRVGNYVEFRPYYQFPMLTISIYDERTGRDYSHPVGNMGFSLCLSLSSDD